MSEFIQKRKPPCTPQQAATITDAILSMLWWKTKDLKKMTGILNPGYILPSGTHFTKLMERKYQEAFEKVKSAMNTTNSRMALTADIWTILQGLSVILEDDPQEFYRMCFLVINAALKDKGIERAVGVARCLVEHFKKNKLKEKQKQMGTPEHKLVQDVSTRWNSTFYMTDRPIEQRWPVTATLSDPLITHRGKRYLDLKPDQWSLVKELSTALKPFECATVFMSGQEYVTVSALKVLPLIQSFQAKAVEQLQIRWNQLFEQADNPVILSSALDPRFRRLKFLSPEQIITVQAKVQTEALAARKEMEQQQQQTTTSARRTEAKPSTSLLDSLLESRGSSEKESREEKAEEDLNTQIRNEVLAYFVESPLAKDENPLDWWGHNKEKYPTLAKLAKCYLCIPGTSTPSERLFSAAGCIASKKRASLNPDHVDMLTFLHSNSKFWNQ
ncbi:E3 SUMO-protein ligase ZBED1 [Labeo rohita]|uniref:E3 SUMO-protein ligase ZBED1 n=1 Tax=Labeo rohita TaxID=84645 RepID=A0ABQ8M6L3_LABRO|nr:E3 SUMO-protein ligase ZBED1 [Labeo rohita]